MHLKSALAGAWALSDTSPLIGFWDLALKRISRGRVALTFLTQPLSIVAVLERYKALKIRFSPTRRTQNATWLLATALWHLPEGSCT